MDTSANRLKQARERKGWSQRQVADGIGTNTFTVGRWEVGLAFPSPHFRQKLADLFACSLSDLGLIPPRSLPHPAHQQREVGLGEMHGWVPPLPLSLPPSFVGRDGLLQTLKEQFFAGGHPSSVALMGLPGVGKTTLALALAADPLLHQRFPAGLLWAGLGPTPNLRTILTSWVLSLGLSAADATHIEGNEALALVIHHLIGERAWLLVIDDAWQIDAALLLRIGGPHCVHLLTTRFPLVATHFAPHSSITVPELTEHAGVELLAQFVPALIQQEEEQTQVLVQAVGGLPLALVVMGNYLQQQSQSRQPRRVQAALASLHEAAQRQHIEMALDPTQIPPHHFPRLTISLASTIALSTQHLSPEARHVLQALTVFAPKPASVAEEVIRQVSGLDEQTYAALDELTDAGLLESARPGRFTLHQTIAEYARGMGELPLDVVDRGIGYYARFLYETQDFPRVDQEYPHILRLLPLGESRMFPEAWVTMVIALAPYWLARTLTEESALWLMRAYRRAQADAFTTQLGSLLLCLGQLAAYQGNSAQAETYAAAGLRAAHQTETQCRCYLLLAALAQKNSDFAAALTQIQAGIHLARAGKHYNLLSRLQTLQGVILGRMSQLPAAERALHKGMRLATFCGDDETRAETLIGLGDLAKQRGDYRSMLGAYEEALALYRGVDHRERICSALIGVGTAYQFLHEVPKALAYYTEAAELARFLGNRERLCSFLLNKGRLLSNHGDMHEARHVVQEGLALAHELGQQRRACIALTILSALEGEHGNLAQAATYAATCLTQSRAIAYRPGICHALTNLGEVHWLQGQYEAGQHVLREGLQLCQEVGIEELAGNMHLILAKIALRCRDWQEAAHEITQGIRLARRLNEPTLLSEVLLAQGQLWMAWQQGAAAKASIAQGRHFAIAAALPTLICDATLRWGDVQLHLGEITTATQAYQEVFYLSRVLSTPIREGEACYGLAQCALAQSDLVQAERYGAMALERCALLGLPQQEEIRSWLAQLSDASSES